VDPNSVHAFIKKKKERKERKSVFFMEKKGRVLWEYIRMITHITAAVLAKKRVCTYSYSA